MTDQEPLSPLAELIAKRERKHYTFDAADFMSKSNIKGEYRMRVPTVIEQDTALLECMRTIQKVTAGTDLANDPDMLNNRKAAHILHQICRRADRDLPLFPSADWMIRNLTADELAVLLNTYYEVARLESPIASELSTETVEALAQLCAIHQSNDAPNLVFNQYTRETIGEIAIRFAVMLDDAKKETESARAELEKVRAELAAAKSARETIETAKAKHK